MSITDEQNRLFVDPVFTNRTVLRAPVGVIPHAFSAVIASSRGLAAGAAILLFAFASVACASGLQTPPVPEGASDGAGPTSTEHFTGVTVPDDTSGLDSEEVERRLGRLLGDPGGGGSDSLAPPDVESPAAPGEPTLQEILDLLNADATSVHRGELVFSISPETMAGLASPTLTIKTQPLHGKATVISSSQIVYMPGGPNSVGDSFEYELFDGTESVIALVVEFRQ